MELSEFLSQVADFDVLGPGDRILLFGWYLHVHRGFKAFANADVRQCFGEAGVVAPDVSVYMPRMAAKSPPELLRDARGYRLERSVRATLDQKYGHQPATIAVAKLLSELPAKVPDIAERAFLDEVVNCYRVRAFRAATVMAWNLAFDHLMRWILADATRLADFNAAIVKKYPKKTGITVAKVEDFEELKESETIEVCVTANLYSGNITKILREKLGRRNTAGHPSAVTVTQAQADDTITDLVNNVVLALT